LLVKSSLTLKILVDKKELTFNYLINILTL
jgi:hypothetical protein